LIVIAAMFVPILPGAIIWLRRRARPIAPVAAPQIHLATVDDIERLTALSIKNIEAVKDTDWSSLLNDPSIVVVCARINPEVVGVAAAREIDDDGTTRILTTYVDPHWRRQYLGSELIDCLMDSLRERGAKSVQATVESRDDRSIGFFASLGWRQRVRVYSRSLLPEEKPKGWRNIARVWMRRLQSVSID
jgi:ribosomal protein S18 acetylase RimI-like enzyme